LFTNIFSTYEESFLAPELQGNKLNYWGVLYPKESSWSTQRSTFR